MRHHYWEWPIATYLFLGGLGGGIFALTAIMQFFVFPGVDLVSDVMAWPCFLAIVFLGLGCVLLVGELGQPLVFYRAFIKNTSVICWGARVLSVCMIFGFIWFLSYIPWDWFAGIAGFLAMFRGVCLALAGLGGGCVVLYTGIFLSSLKAHSFWATPALPVLFTISALSTACACITISIGWWPAEYSLATIVVSEVIHELLHELDVILVVAEIIVLLVMVLSFLGAGNVTANKVAHRWVNGSWAALFWVGMIGIGLVIPEILYIFASGAAANAVAPVLVLCGGCLLRYLVVYSDDRAPLPGENEYYEKLPNNKAAFIHKWTYGKNIF